MLVSRPRVNLVLYHEVLAPLAAWQRQVMPTAASQVIGGAAPDHPPAEDPTSPEGRGWRWADLVRRVSAVDVPACGHCGGRLDARGFRHPTEHPAPSVYQPRCHRRRPPARRQHRRLDRLPSCSPSMRVSFRRQGRSVRLDNAHCALVRGTNAPVVQAHANLPRAKGRRRERGHGEPREGKSDDGRPSTTTANAAHPPWPEPTRTNTQLRHSTRATSSRSSRFVILPVGHSAPTVSCLAQ